MGAASGRYGARLAWVPLPLFAVALALSVLFAPHGTFDWPWLLLTINAVFLTALPLTVAALAVPAYRRTGHAAVLALGAGALAMSGSGVLPALLDYVSGPAAAIAMHNTAVLLAGVCNLVAVVVAIRVVPPRPPVSRGRWIAVTYLAVLCGLAALMVLVATGLMPRFATGDGFTPLRQLVLGAAAVLFVLAALFWAITWTHLRITFLWWYWLGLALFAVGLSGVLAQRAFGSLDGWLGRGAQYLAGVYLLTAVLRVRSEYGLAVALTDSTLPYRPMVESSADPVIAVDRDDHILYWNDAAHRRFGYDPADVLGADLVERVAASRGQAGLRQAVLACRDSGRPVTAELALAGPDGTPFPAEVALYPVSDRPDWLTMCLVRDISERKQAEAQIRALNRDLEVRVADRTAELESANQNLVAVNAELESFSYSVSHDLRAPLRAINGFTDILRERYDDRLDAEARRLLDRVSANSARMDEMINEILSLSRMTRREMDTGVVDMTALANDAVAELREADPDRRISVTVRPLDEAVGDRALLAHVWMNLLSNAFKFTATVSPAEVTVDSHRTDGEIAYRVCDNGVGFDMAHADKVFTAFQRLHTTQQAGTGVGLAIVKRVITRHHGRVWADSAPGRGACFTFTLAAPARGRPPG